VDDENAERNLVCFDLNFRASQDLQLFLHLTPFDHVYSHYLSMAIKFFNMIGEHDTLSGEVVWRIQDDATIDPILQLKFILAGVASVGHSVHRERGDVSLYTALVPNFHFIEQDGFSELSNFASTNSEPLSSLQPQIFWAGSTTGFPCRGQRPCNNTCEDLQRYQLAKMSQGIKWLNVSLTNAIQACQGEEAQLNASNMLSQRTSETDWFQYRGIIDIDGNVDAWGLRWRLATNSVVFRMKSDYVNHYSDQLSDGKNYIEILEDLSDLKSKTAVIMRHDTAALTYLAHISRNAHLTVAKITLESSSEKAASALKFFLDQHEIARG